MPTVSFSISKLNALRSAAVQARRIPDRSKLTEGWSKSSVDPAALLAVFDTLRLKPGFVLRAYQYWSSSGNGNGIVWTLPEEADYPEPDTCPRLKKYFLEPPKPPGALRDCMSTIEGDGSPWSYLSASILGREMDEFGAVWHGCNWSDHTILGINPWEGPQPVIESPQEEWTWTDPKPALWDPQVMMEGKAVKVNFITYTGFEGERLILHTDTYTSGRYKFKSNAQELASGKRGYIH